MLAVVRYARRDSKDREIYRELVIKIKEPGPLNWHMATTLAYSGIEPRERIVRISEAGYQ